MKQTKTYDVARLKRAVKAEAKADAERVTANEVWRSAWWETTHLLAECPDAIWPTVKAEYLKHTGHADSRASSRRRIGRTFSRDILADPSVFTLPGPRMSEEAVKVLGSSPAPAEITKMVQRVLEAEAIGTSLRSFAQELTGKSWTSSPPDMTPADEDAVVARMARSRPEALAAAVADNPRLMGAIDEERNRRRSANPAPHPDAIGVDERHMDTASLLSSLEGITARIRRDVDDNRDLWTSDPRFNLRLRESAIRLSGYADIVDGISDADLADLLDPKEAS
jgi:hypothetical protein